MPVIDLQQNTPEWLEFRKGKIGASDCGIICEFSPYCSPYTLWLRKLGLAQEQEENHAMREGKRLEPYALDLFNKEHNLNLSPAVYQHDSIPWIFASLDGYDGNNLVEIKCSKYLWENEFIPAVYVYQMQHQMMVTGLNKCFYFIFWEGKGRTFLINRDEEKISIIHEKEEEFYRCMTEYVAPPISENDFIHSTDETLKGLTELWKVSSENTKICEEIEENIRKEIIERCQGQSTICNGVKMQKIPRKGNIQYNLIPQIKEIDLEPYRKDPTESWRFTSD